MSYPSFFDRRESSATQTYGQLRNGLHVMAHVATAQPQKRDFFQIPEEGVRARRILYYAHLELTCF